RSIKIGNAASQSVGYTQTGGTVTATANTHYIADAATSTTATATVSGGLFNAEERILIVATRGNGTLNVAGTGEVRVGTLWFGHNSVSSGATSGTVNLDGGTLAVQRIARPGAIGTSVFNFNGGLLKATSSSAFFLAGNSAGDGFVGITRANVRDGGARIDTNGFDITVGQG